MAYNKTVWYNLPSTASPINAANLNKIENQLLEPAINYVDFETTYNHVHQIGRAAWSLDDDTLTLDHKGGVQQQIGEETYVRVTNNTGTAFNNGDLIGLAGNGTTVVKYNSNGSVPPMFALGVATQPIVNGERGRLTVWGRVRGLDTSAFNVGDVVYANPAIPGGLTNVKPTAPNLCIPIGVVVEKSATAGIIFVRPILEQQRYYGLFVKTADASPALINTLYPIEFDTTQVSNGVTIGTPASRITVDHSGLYVANVSFQLTSTNSSIKNVYLWFRKNGVDVANSTIIRSLESGTAVGVQSRSVFFSLNAGDYIEAYWAADSTAVLLDARAATAFSPTAPAVLLSLNQIQQ